MSPPNPFQKREQRAEHLRRLFLIVALTCLYSGTAIILSFPVPLPDPYVPFALPLTPLCWGLFPHQNSFVLCTTWQLGLLLLVQWAFLRPRRGWTIQLAEKGVPLKSAVIVAALMAMLLTLAFAYTLLELLFQWNVDDSIPAYWIWYVALCCWGAWGAVFYCYWRGTDRFRLLSRMTAWLLRGSFLELLVAVPVHVIVVPRKGQCYCTRGSYTGIVFGLTVMVWAFGPAIVLLYLREQYRLQKLLTPPPENPPLPAKFNDEKVQTGRTDSETKFKRGAND